MSERKAELANDEEKDELVARCEKVQSITIVCASVDAFQQLQTDIASVLGRKKQDPKSYAKKQLSEVTDARGAMLGHVVNLAHKELAFNVNQCVDMFLYALSHDGYTEMQADDVSCEPCDRAEVLRGVLGPTSLEGK